MGSGTWSPSTYAATTRSKISSGTTFGYSHSVASGAVPAAVHPDLHPGKVAGPASPLAGQIVREARDSDEHPFSVPVAVFFDETGSMGNVPRLLQTKLAELFALLLRKGYVEHPQLLVGAYGDASLGFEAASLQAGQFESDNRADEDLDRLYLEGNGGGNGHETAALAWYYIATYARTDAWEKRGKRGYLITIGDETTGGVSPEYVRQYIDPNTELQARLSPAEVLARAAEQWDVYHFVINNQAAYSQDSIKRYTDLLGSNCIVVQDPASVAEIIATTIGIAEGAIDLDEGLDNLDDISPAARGEVGKALAKRTGSGKVAVAMTPGDLVGTEPPADRL